jgi:hypothetical protein
MVFDVTKFLFDHPGGAHLITGKAGQDITEAFEVNNHSQRARTLLVDFFKGKVAAVNANASQSSSTVSTSSSSPSSPPASSKETNNSSSSTTVSSTPSSPATPSSNASSLPSLKVLYATQKGAARRFAQMLAAEVCFSSTLISSDIQAVLGHLPSLVLFSEMALDYPSFICFQALHIQSHTHC